MNKIAMMLSRDRLDSPLAATFGKAKWILLYEAPDRVEFRRNETLSGGSVASTIASAGCRDLIASHLGEKARAHVGALGIRVWEGPADVPAREVIARHARGDLKAWSHATGTDGSGCASGDSKRGDGHHEHRGASPPAPLTQLGRRRHGD